MKLVERIGREILYFDGGSGTMLQKMGLMPGELPDNWNLSHPDRIRKLHREYLRAGADFVLTNTFGVNALKFDDPETIIRAAFANAFAAREDCADMGKTQYVAFDMGPLGRMLRPLGDLDFEDAVALFARNVRCAAECGADVILIETMMGLPETTAALEAARAVCDLPVLCTFSVSSDGMLYFGGSVLEAAQTLEALGADAVGVNCSSGPDQLESVIRNLREAVSIPIVAKPNAGMPIIDDEGHAVYPMGAGAFGESMKRLIAAGASIAGGCCGTTPEHIAALRAVLRGGK